MRRRENVWNSRDSSDSFPSKVKTPQSGGGAGETCSMVDKLPLDIIYCSCEEASIFLAHNGQWRCCSKYSALIFTEVSEVPAIL